MAKERFYCWASGLLLLSWSLGDGGNPTDLPREAVRHILAGGLSVDMACDKLVGWATESCHEQVVG